MKTNIFTEWTPLVKYYYYNYYTPHGQAAPKRHDLAVLIITTRLTCLS